MLFYYSNPFLKHLLAIYLTLLDYYEQKSVRERQRDKSASEPLPLNNSPPNSDGGKTGSHHHYNRKRNKMAAFD